MKQLILKSLYPAAWIVSLAIWIGVSVYNHRTYKMAEDLKLEAKSVLSEFQAFKQECEDLKSENSGYIRKIFELREERDNAVKISKDAIRSSEESRALLKQTQDSLKEFQGILSNALARMELKQ